MIGKALAGAAFVAAAAVVPPSVNVQQVTTVAALFGGVLLAMSQANAIIFAPVPPSNREKARAVYEAVSSMIAAAIAGYFVAPAVCFYLHQTQTEVVAFIGLCLGMMFWKFVPAMIEILTKQAEKWGLAKGAKIS